MALLQDPHVEKVFHHAPFDLRFMVGRWPVRAQSVRCTKVASKLLNPAVPNEAHSLASLLDTYLGIQLTKGAVRTSDWGAPELSSEQLAYAAADVRHLLAVHEVLVERLKKVQRDEMYSACCDFLATRVALELGGFPDVFAY
jgi:ribonuclease D